MTIILVAIIGERLSKANEFLVFAGLCTLGASVMAWMGVGFTYRQALGDEEDKISVSAVNTSLALAQEA